MTLRENNLKELEGGHILWSQGVLVANRRALKERPGLLEVVHELIERFEAHLEAGKFYNVLANMRGSSAAEVLHHQLFAFSMLLMIWWILIEIILKITLGTVVLVGVVNNADQCTSVRSASNSCWLAAPA